MQLIPPPYACERPWTKLQLTTLFVIVKETPQPTSIAPPYELSALTLFAVNVLFVSVAVPPPIYMPPPLDDAYRPG